MMQYVQYDNISVRKKNVCSKKLCVIFAFFFILEVFFLQ